LLTAVLTPAPEGGFTARNPETGSASQGETVDEAIANLRETTELYLEEFPLRSAGQPLITTFDVEVNAQPSSGLQCESDSRARAVGVRRGTSQGTPCRDAARVGGPRSSESTQVEDRDPCWRSEASGRYGERVHRRTLRKPDMAVNGTCRCMRAARVRIMRRAHYLARCTSSGESRTY
jgi:predicted RNase H-like HicB family nuclease